MAENSDAAERTEAPTQKRRRDSREKGQVARSQELNSLVILTAGAMLILSLHNYMIDGMKDIFVQFFLTPHAVVEPGNMNSLAQLLFNSFFPIVMPVFLGIIVAGLFVNFSQVGFHVTADALVPKLERINPVEGFKKLFSWRAVFETFKGLIKIGVISYVAYKTLRPALGQILSLSLSSSPDLVGVYLKIGLNFVLRALVVMLIVAGLDYVFQLWQHEKSIRMSLRELKDEFKETEGDPLVRQRVRSIQREMARRRMMEDVKKADVVITNPTTLAIALKYESGMQSPKVLAKGKETLARRIRDLAGEHGVPVVENKPLARALYKACKVGGYVPVHLYKAVAEILAYVYSLKRKKVNR